MRCQNCHKDFHNAGVLLNADGDFACNKECTEEYKKKRDYFFSTVIYSDVLMNKWWYGKE